jgi:MFS family permease
VTRDRQFAISFAAISATSFCFILRALVVDSWGVEFGLSETQKGELLGVGLWPFAITIILLSLVIDRIGFKAAFWFAGVCHLIGLGILLAADGYWPLYAGTFVMALGNGAVEAAANPLIATVYAEDRPRWLNRLHAAWPGGMIIGGLCALALGPATDWRIKVALMLLPISVYTLLLFRARLAVSQRVSSGISYRAMLAESGWLSVLIVVALMMLEIARVASLPAWATLATIGALTGAYAFYARSAGRPLYIILLLLMIPLATTELSTDSWISSLMAPEMGALGLQAGWVLIYTAALVFVIRLFAGTIIEWLSPLGTLAAASVATAAGLFLLANAAGLALLAAATLYGIGKSFFWGTSLAIASDQFPRGGAVTINIMAGAGMLAAGIVGSVLLGAAQDLSSSRAMIAHDNSHGTTLSQRYLTTKEGSLYGSYRALDTATIERAPAEERVQLEAIRAASKKQALREVALLPLLMLVTYLALMVFFRARGGYRPAELPVRSEAA